MKRNTRTNQGGYALILMVLALMGLGGVVMTGFTQDASRQSEQQRYLHNERVLKEAKQALLQYAYDYPVNFPGRGPGRLPCPDIDGNGTSDAVPGCDGAAGVIGRFPWNTDELNFYQARDAAGEELWYAVSSNFANSAAGPAVINGPGAINSGTPGAITIADRSGVTLFDATGDSGAVAVIIAPGTPIERGGVLQDRAAGPNLAINYLDLFGAIDNAVFTNGTANGFVRGPIFNPVDGSLAVNDQFIVITAAEVAEMAEMATLQAYREAINLYRARVGCLVATGINEADCLANGGFWNPVYPWLYNYRDVTNLAELSSFYPARNPFELDPDGDPGTDDGYLGNYGRIPSIFAEYFTETDSQPIESFVTGKLTLIDPAGSDTFTLNQVFCDKSCGTGGTRTFSRDPDPDEDGPEIDLDISQILTGVRFVDIDPNNTDNMVRLRANFPVPEQVPFTLYFWGDHNTQTTNWTACPGGANEISDCAFPDNRSILRLDGTIDFSGIQDFDFDHDFPPSITWTRASGADHGWITATYSAEAIAAFPGVFPVTVSYAYDGHWHSGDAAIDTSDDDYSTGTVDMAGFTLGSLTLGMRYYPELPDWAFRNGWHDAVRMAYADTYLPSLPGDCQPVPDGDPTNDCLSLPEELGAPRNIASLLVIAGEHDWDDGDGDGMADELRDVFDNGNNNNNLSFYSRRSISPLNADRGNDRILVIEER